MKFNKTLNASIINEWRFYSVDYKSMKKVLKEVDQNESDSVSSEFFSLYELSKTKITKFYGDKEAWAVSYFQTMEERMNALRACKVSVQLQQSPERSNLTDSDSASSASDDSDSDDEEMQFNIEEITDSFENGLNLSSVISGAQPSDPKASAENQEWL